MPNLFIYFLFISMLPIWGVLLGRIYNFTKGKMSLHAIIGTFDYSKALLIILASSNYYELQLIIIIRI
jgi:hypothetical protein